MSEFIGSRISLISKRNIRYAGTLHEINSEDSTVALENVTSFGTEEREQENRVPPSDHVYPYIVFKGGDVKDLRIEDGPKGNTPPKPQMPDDPAILGSTRRPSPPPSQAASQQSHRTPQPPGSQPLPLGGLQNEQRQGGPPPFQQYPPQPYHNFPPPHGYGRGFPQGPPGPGGPGPFGPYGAPPGGFYAGPPPQFPYGMGPGGPGGFPPHMPGGPPGQQNRQQVPNDPSPGPLGPIGGPSRAPATEKDAVSGKSASTGPSPAPLRAGAPPPPPVASKPDSAAALAPPAPPETQVVGQSPKGPSNANKPGRIIPAVPLYNQYNSTAKVANGTMSQATASAGIPTDSQTEDTAKSFDRSSQDARAAVAAAMAKMNIGGQKKQDTPPTDNLTKKVIEMRTNENARSSGQEGTGRRGSWGGYRGGRGQGRKIEVPKEDYDFESANAKFNKQDLVKEAIATGSPLHSPTEEVTGGGGAPEGGFDGARRQSETVAIPPGPSYNRTSSFFDSLSSEITDRAEKAGQQINGREFRAKERQQNMETFGQGSVDGGYRGNGRGRGRGRGFRGRGYRARGGPRGEVPASN